MYYPELKINNFNDIRLEAQMKYKINPTIRVIMKRIFIGLKTEPLPRLKHCVKTLSHHLSGEKIKWVNPDNWHLTLHFLGNTSPQLIERIDEILSHSAAHSNSFPLTFKGLGIFPNLHRPKVLWAGIDESPQMMELYQCLFPKLKALNFDLDKRPYAPHLTLARIKKLSPDFNLMQKLEKYQTKHWGQLHIKEITLFESVTKQEGPAYVPLRKYALRR